MDYKKNKDKLKINKKIYYNYKVNNNINNQYNKINYKFINNNNKINFMINNQF